MPLTPKAVRIRTASGWQDVALAGAPGATGPDSRVIVRKKAIGGPGTTMPIGTTSLAGLAITFATDANPTGWQGRVDFAARIDAVVAAWNYIYFLIACTPAPVDRLADSTMNPPNAVGLRGLYQGGDTWSHLPVFDHFWLAPSTTYTFQAQVNSGAAAFMWSTELRSYMLGEFWKR